MKSAILSVIALLFLSVTCGAQEPNRPLIGNKVGAGKQQWQNPRPQPKVIIQPQVRLFVPYTPYYRSYMPRYRYYWQYNQHPINPNFYRYNYYYEYRYPVPQIQRGGLFFQFRF